MIPIKDYPGPRRSLPIVTWGIIIINVAVFLYQVSLGSNAQEFMFAYSLVPAALFQGIPQTSMPGALHTPFQTPNPVYLTLITSLFLHAGWLHIGGNMLYLYIFGDNVEDRMGHFPYLIFYLFCGIVASLVQSFASSTGQASVIPSLGASGAIAGVLGAYIILFPLAGVRTIIFIVIFFTIVTLPAIVLIGVWFLLQLFDSLASLGTTQQGMGGVAYLAHVGGFLTGLVITWLWQSRRQPPADISYPYFPRHPNASGPSNWWGQSVPLL